MKIDHIIRRGAKMLSSIILTWNSEAYIEECLLSLIEDAQNINQPIEIFIVDSGSTDKTLDILSKFTKEISEIQLMELGRNLGTTLSRNLALKKSKGDYLLVLDSDTVVLPGTIKALLQAFKDNPLAGIVAPRLFYPDGPVQPSCKRLPTLPIKVCKFLPCSWLQRIGERGELYPSKIYSKNFKSVIRVDYCISACWLIRREAINTIGLLDENIFYAPEDVDYCLRMWLAGWEVLYVPSAEVVHYTQRRSYKNFNMAWIHIKGLFYYFKKYRYFFNRKKVYRLIQNVAQDNEVKFPIGL
jgi:hypothetical protein